jgi:hypothetical protein
MIKFVKLVNFEIFNFFPSVLIMYTDDIIMITMPIIFVKNFLASNITRF